MAEPKITYSSDPNSGLIEFFVDGEYLTTWSYENHPDDAFDEFKKVFMSGWYKAKRQPVVIRDDLN